jgi:hypothetical protein
MVPQEDCERWSFLREPESCGKLKATSLVRSALLGAVFRGILCSDRFSAYLKYHSG